MKSKSALCEIRLVSSTRSTPTCNSFFLLENPYAWLISSPKKSFIVRANSDRERQEWLIHLDRCIHHASGKFDWLVSTVVLFDLIQVEVMAVRILSLHIGFPTTMQTHVCIVVHRNSRLTIDDMWEFWRSVSLSRLWRSSIVSALSQLWLHRLWWLLEETLSSSTLGFETSSSVWCMPCEVE